MTGDWKCCYCGEMVQFDLREHRHILMRPPEQLFQLEANSPQDTLSMDEVVTYADRPGVLTWHGQGALAERILGEDQLREVIVRQSMAMRKLHDKLTAAHEELDRLGGLGKWVEEGEQE